MADDILGVTLEVAQALEASGIRYSVGGSLASGFSGEPRFTLDVDIAVVLQASQVDAFVSRLGLDYYADAAAIQRAVRQTSSVNLIHRPTNIKVDLFVVAPDSPAAMQVFRRQARQLTEDHRSVVFFHSHEDILLQKLLWFRSGGEVSERQWRDVVAIVRVRGVELDRSYLWQQATVLGVKDLLQRLGIADS